jgi:hypothetical protein
VLYSLLLAVLLTDYLTTNISGINGEELKPHADKICVEFSEELQRRTERKRVPVRQKNHQERSKRKLKIGEIQRDGIKKIFFISNFRLVRSAVVLLLGNSPASEYYMPEYAYEIQTPGNYPEESIRQ